VNIYVGNLSYNTTETDLREAFAKHGEVNDVRMITDRDTGRSKGFGFVEMPNAEEAQAAMSALNETDLHERTIKVNEAKPREDRPQRGGGGGGRW
jgi:RNA recognition motif-containing protein